MPRPTLNPLSMDSGETSSSTAVDQRAENISAPRQRNTSNESSSGVPRNVTPYPQKDVASPSSILSAYGRPSIDHHMQPHVTEARQRSRDAAAESKSSRSSKDEIYAWSRLEDGLNDDTIKVSARKGLPAEPARAFALETSQLLLDDTGSMAASSVETAIPSLSFCKSDYLARKPSSASSIKRNNSFSSSRSVPSQHSRDLPLANASAGESPYIDLSSTSSSSSSYFPSHVESSDSTSSPFEDYSNNSLNSGYVRQSSFLDTSGMTRTSTYTSITSASDWAREREEAIKNSQSGIFDLEYELEGEEARIVPPSLHTPPYGQLALPVNTIAASPSPPSPGFGLGITSDDAIHPDMPQSAPASTFPSSEYFAVEPLTSDNVCHQQSASAGPNVATKTTSSRWNTTVPWTRRSTVSSVRSLHRVASHSSLVHQHTDPKALRHAASQASLASSRDLATASSAVPKMARSNSSAEHQPRRARRRSPSFSAFSTSSIGHAAIATMSYADPDSTGSRTGSLTTSEGFDENQEYELEEPLLQGNAVQNQAGESLTPLDRPRSQAVALVESGQSEIVRLEEGDLLSETFIGQGTTHLLLKNASQPVELRHLLDASLPNIAACLVVLDISNCHLTSIPGSISICSNLEELNLSRNPIISGVLPPFLSLLRGLRVLLADSCEVTHLPHSLAASKQLHTLSIRNNFLTCFPSWLRHLSGSLELLLAEGNPWYGDYADLAASLQGHSEPPRPAQAASAPKRSVQEQDETTMPAASRKTSPSLVTLYDEFAKPKSEEAPSLDASPPSRDPETSLSSPRASLMARARSYRAGLRRPSTLSDHEDEDSNESDLRMTSHASSRSSSFTRRPNILRLMRSMGDIPTPQPSIYSLVESSDTSVNDASRASQREAMPGRLNPGSSREMTIGEFFSSGTSEDSYEREHGGQASNPANVNRYEGVFESLEERDAEPEQSKRGRKPSFFRKISMAAKERKAKMERKRSHSVVGRETEESKPLKSKNVAPLPDLPKDLSQSKLGRGRPFAPFITEDMRSASAPAVAAAGLRYRTETAASVRTISPAISPVSVSSTFAKNSNIIKTRPSKLSKPAPLPETHLSTGKQTRRRSYLMLDSVLPEVVSPGPLALTFSNRSSEDATIHVKPFALAARDDDTIVIDRSKKSAIASSEGAVDAKDDERQRHERKAALAPLMAYLQDLDELMPENASVSPSLGSDSPDRHSTVSEEARSASKKTSSAALSISSNPADRNSGYASSQTDTSRLASPTNLQDSKQCKDNPVKRERVISEIISSEKSYLSGLQDLVAIYIQPASAPVRSSSSSNASRETYIPQSERNIVFSVAESIAHFHNTVFLPELEKAALFVAGDRDSVNSLDEVLLRQAAQDVARIFSRQAAFLKIYHSYCINFDAALDRVALWRSFQTGTSTPDVMTAAISADNLTANHKKRIRELLKTAQKHPRHDALGLNSYLLLPIQRIPRYKMLLEALLACTPSLEDPCQPDPTISEALQTMSELANDMNEKKRDSEGRKRLLYWQSRMSMELFKSPLVQPHRSLLKEGSITLSRIVKKSSAIVASSRPDDAEPSLLQINCLSIDASPKQLLYILCSDILVLFVDPGHASGPVTPFTVLRLGRALGGRTEPASIFQNMLRIVDARAILYLTCASAEQAIECRELINLQSRRNEESLAVPTQLLLVRQPIERR